ncbi:KxYKxGKxW signal peptide domain-containing protein [Lactobacillus helveticus]|uniref:KxYKxGKxW signal peptide domain-containing protein n=1 Tax=Lactobacillus helveticus TaxID=1587 RepID=UPI0021AC5DA8|nr:KxYKxGKxW signal peptide domain-containing protein [Lactobacillus helveticus]
MGEKKLHYKMYKDGKKFVFAAIPTLSFFAFSGASTVAVHADTTSGNLTAATVNSTSDTKSAVSSAATVASSSSATKADSTSASSSSATKADSANATSTNEYSASASNLSKTGAASTSNSTAVKTNAKYANSVETVDNNKRGNRENTHSINQRRIVKRSAVVPSAGKITINRDNFTVSVTASDGSTMNNGSSFNLSGQLAHLKAINLGFTLTQDGTLTPGSTIKIPVSVTNNSSALVSSALSSGTSLDIQSVGTIKYQADDRYGTSGSYIITIGDSFDQIIGKKVIAAVTEKPAETASLVATNSTQNIVLTIDDNTFTFVPVKRIYEKDTQNYSSSDYAWSPAADQINTGTTIKDPNYVNNMLESNGTDAGNTKIPMGNIVNIQRVKTSGSAITNIHLGKYLGTQTLPISEDGTYLIKGDDSADYNFKSGTGVTNLKL